jgi:CRP-like cAMP-binding protein
MTTTDSPVAALAGIHIFAGLRKEVLETLAQCCIERHVEAGETIVEENSMGREIYLIAEGGVRIVSQCGLPGETALAELGRGGFFGEMSVIECARRSASAIAVEPSVLYALSNADIHGLFKRWPDQFSILILNISRDLCRRLRAMNKLFAAGQGLSLAGYSPGL